MARIRGIQEAIDYGKNPHLDILESTLTIRLEKLLSMEEPLWFQKPRKQWICDGDRNTTFYNAKTIMRKIKNQIVKLRDDIGDWIANHDQVKHMTIYFYKNPFLEDSPNRPNLVTVNQFLVIDDGILRLWVILSLSMKLEEISFLWVR